MKTLKKILATLLALTLMMAMGMTALAADETNSGASLEGGEAGTWTEKDTKKTVDTSINIVKEIIAFNANGTVVNAPVVTYTYTVKPADVSGLTVTDQKEDHNSNEAVMAPVNAGITTGLVVTGSEAGEAGDEASAAGMLVFDNTKTLNTSKEGTANSYNINLDFAGVTFIQPGVYRYQIEESISAETYAEVALEDGGSNIRYLDVYVGGDLKIYGYVCMKDNESVTPDTAKTNGFVPGSGENSDGSDKYYTYDLTISKTVENDTYGKNSIAYPFTVIFNNNAKYTSTFTINEIVGDGSEGISPAKESLPTWSGVAEVKHGGAITYTGIPAGVDVEVYETNIATGVTYRVETSVNGGEATTDAAVSWGSAPSSAVAQDERALYESTKATVDTEGIKAVNSEQTIAITNTLVEISPTGVVLRVAPYALILVAGMALLLVSRRRKARNEE